MNAPTGPHDPADRGDGDGPGAPEEVEARARTGVAGGIRLFGIPVRIDVSFLIVVLLLGWGLESDPAVLLVWVVVATVSVLVHELGHAFAFRAFGHTPRIDLFGLGGATSSGGGPELGPARQLLVSAAGPMAGMLLGVVGLVGASLFTPQDRLADAAVTFLVWASIGWSLLNLLPVLPLDGGRVLEAGLELLTGRSQAAAALAVSAAVAAAGAVVAVAYGQLFSALLAGWFAVVNLAGLRRRRGDPGGDERRLARGYQQLATGDHEGAGEIARGVQREAGTDAARAGAATLLAWSWLLRGRAEEAAAAFEQAAASPQAGTVLRPEVVRAAGGRERAVALLRSAYEARRGEATGVPLVVALVEAGRADEAVALVDGDPALATLRDDDGFARVRGLAAGWPGGDGNRTAGAPGPPAGATAPVLPGVGSCYRHAGVAPRRGCPRCGRPICGRCTIPTTAGRLCPPCVLEVGRDRTVIGLGLLATLAVIGVVFLLQQASPEVTERYALVPVFVAAGEWYRLLTPMLLHAGLAHIAFNGYALWLFGRQAELGLGTLRYLALFVVSGFAGNAAHYAFGPCTGIAVGASGGVFGVLGGLAWFVYQRRELPQARSQLRGIAVLIALNLALGFAVPRIANLAHIGGLLAGIVLVAGFDRYRRHVPTAAQIAVVAAVVVASWGLSMWRTDGFAASCAAELRPRLTAPAGEGPGL